MRVTALQSMNSLGDISIPVVLTVNLMLREFVFKI
jgi:hypothetical protein